MSTFPSFLSIQPKLKASAGLVAVAIFLCGLAYALSPREFFSLTPDTVLAALQIALAADPTGTGAAPTVSLAPDVGATPATASATYIVTRVIDGDTIEVVPASDSATPLSAQTAKPVKVRLIGVDTPETVDPRKGVQCFGKAASDRTKQLLEGKPVTLVKDVSETDRYHRWLRYVYVDGVFINQQLVLEGYAHARSYPPDIKYQADFRAAEQTASEQKRGMWAEGVCP